MAEAEPKHLTQASLSVDGSDIGKDKFNKIRLIRVESCNNGPDTCRVEIHSEVTGSALGNPLSEFVIGGELEVSLAGQDVDGNDINSAVFKGLITGMGGSWGADQPGFFVVEAFSHDHKLSRVRKTMTADDVKASDFISSVVSEVGLSASVDATSATHPYMAMNNQTPFDYVQELARRFDYEVWSEGSTVNIKKHRLASASSCATLTYGANLHRVRFRAQTAGLFTKVRVFSSRPLEATQLIGEAGDSDISLLGGSSGVGLAEEKFGEGEYHISNYQAESQAEVDDVAKAVINQIGRRFVSMEAEVEGTPTILAGNTVTIEGISQEFNGDYYVQRAIHVYDIQGTGYRTHVVCCRPCWGG
jgi:hypothetical protein